MTPEQIEKAAQQYAEPTRAYLLGEETMQIKEAFVAGAYHALQHQWISVDEQLPEDINPKLVYVEDIGISPELSHTIAYYEKGTWHFLDSYYYDCKISHWLPIPQLNPEKEER